MWKLDYDGVLRLHLSADEAVRVLQYSSFYKLSLRRYVFDVSQDFVRFKSALTYLDYKKIIALCKNEAEKRQISFVIGAALKEYIESRELHIEARSRLGIELKEHHTKLHNRYEAFRKIVDGGMARKLRDRQMWDSFFMCAMQKSANFSVPGSGKTASVLGMYAYLRSKSLVKRIIVICPKNAFGSWIDEFSVCFDAIEPLRVLNIHAPMYRDLRQRSKALQYDGGRYNLILVNYESVRGVIDSLVQLVETQTLLVFDEVHKVKRVNGEHAEYALQLSRKSSYTVAMTGTPIPNSYTDIYNLLHILFPYEYDEFFDFRISMLCNPKSREIELINNKLQPFFCRTTKECLGVPKANDDILCVDNANAAEAQLLKVLKLRYRNNKLALLVRILQLESNPRLLLKSVNLSEFSYLLDDSVEAAKIDYVDYSEEVKQLIDKCCTTTKFERCIQLIKLLVKQKKTVIVWCMFVDSIKNLSVELEKDGVKTCCIYGEVSLEDRQQILTNFKNGLTQVLLTNPHTLAESVSLHSVCHDAIYFEYSYNLVHLLQSKDRIHRLGLPDNQYTQYYYHQLFYQLDEGRWSLGETVYNRLKEKEQIMCNAIDNHVLESMPTSDEDLDVIFSKLL